MRAVQTKNVILFVIATYLPFLFTKPRFPTLVSITIEEVQT